MIPFVWDMCLTHDARSVSRLERGYIAGEYADRLDRLPENHAIGDCLCSKPTLLAMKKRAVSLGLKSTVDDYF